MLYSVELNIFLFSYIYESASFASAKYYLARYSQTVAALAATTALVEPQRNKIVKI